MLKIENTEVMGQEAAIHGMHNITEYWEESDSFVPCYWKTKCNECEVNQNCAYYFENGGRTKKRRIYRPQRPSPHESSL